MKQSDFDNPLQMAQHCHDLYEKIRQAKRMLLRVDVQPGNANHVKFKATLQWIDSAIDELTFEDKSLLEKADHLIDAEREDRRERSELS